MIHSLTTMLKTIIIIYLIIGSIVSIKFARKYWIDFRSSDNKYNVVYPYKWANRIIDSYVGFIAYLVYVLLYPIHILTLLINYLKEVNKK